MTGGAACHLGGAQLLRRGDDFSARSSRGAEFLNPEPVGLGGSDETGEKKPGQSPAFLDTEVQKLYCILSPMLLPLTSLLLPMSNFPKYSYSSRVWKWSLHL